jgi:hypothetical protein
MARRLLAFISLISLLLCVAMAALWAQSYRRTDALMAGFWGYRYHPRYTNYYDAWELNAFNDHGKLKLRLWLRGCVAGPGRYEAFPRQKGRLFTVGPADPYRLEAAEFDIAHAQRTRLAPDFRYRSTARVRLAVIPHADAVGFTALLPLIATVYLLRRRRLLQPGLCPICGYDLRASKDRCPECGTQIGQALTCDRA